MRKTLLVLAIAIFCVGVVLPIILISLHHNSKPQQGSIGVRLLMPDGKIQTLNLEDYLVGVVAAEMPANFDSEALKAQAVAARTYTALRLSQPDITSRSYDMDTTIKTQAWLSDKAMRQSWGTVRYFTNKLKIQNAVKATKGLVLVYEGTYVQAFYFSCAGRLPTEKAEDVWGSPLPYLTNVKPEPQEKSKFVTTNIFTAAEINTKLGTNLSTQHKLSTSDITIVARTSAGRAKTVKVGTKEVQATLLRANLGLKSTDITISIDRKNRVVFTAYGNGHAVGMSQYGANFLGKKGSDFKAILLHYYPGTQLINIENQKS